MGGAGLQFAFRVFRFLRVELADICAQGADSAEVSSLAVMSTMGITRS